MDMETIAAAAIYLYSTLNFYIVQQRMVIKKVAQKKMVDAEFPYYWFILIQIYKLKNFFTIPYRHRNSKIHLRRNTTVST